MRTLSEWLKLFEAFRRAGDGLRVTLPDGTVLEHTDAAQAGAGKPPSQRSDWAGV